MGIIKNQIRRVAISIIATSILFISFGSAQERAVKLERPAKKNVVLHNPSQLSPTSGTVFNKFPRHTVLRWSKVDGAASYMVEVEYNVVFNLNLTLDNQMNASGSITVTESGAT